MTTENNALISRFLATFQSKDPKQIAAFFHPDIVFTNYGDPDVRGKDNVAAVWKRVFSMFDTVRFETINQASHGDVVLAEQFHYLALPGKETAPIRNMAAYEIRDGLIAAWRDYTDSKHAKKLLEEARPLAS